MNCKIKRIWILTAFLGQGILPVNVQFAMPMCVPSMLPPVAPMFPIPAPMPIMTPALCPLPISDQLLKKTSTTTTTTERPKNPDSFAFGVPVPVAIPVPMAVPSFIPPNICQGPPPRPKNCPPCPPCVCKPSCTPSFYSYCSPCHMKCRCKNQDDTPRPLPNRPAPGPAYGMPVQIPPIMGPPPIVIVPYPPPIQIPIRKQRRKPIKKPKYSSCSEESIESSSSESNYVRKIRRGKRKRIGSLRTSFRSSESDNELVKPMLSYITENGDVKFKTKINSDDVADLLGEKEVVDNHQIVRVITTDHRKNEPVVIVSKNEGKPKRERYKKVFLRGGVSHVLDSGKKELIFKPTGNQKITNLSVSFQLS